MARSRRPSRNRGFTLFEVVVVVIIVAILATLTVGAVSKLRARAQRVQCSANLKNLYIATDLFLQDNGSWPQIPLTGDQDYANAWVAALTPYNVTRKTWICPTVQGALHDPDYWQPENARVDYTAMQFDDKPGTPHKWPRQPWFVETGDVHGHGNLIIFTDGSINDLKTVTGAAARP